ncbi:glycosyltransferase family 61 protein [Salmonirosea aquatica]
MRGVAFLDAIQTESFLDGHRISSHPADTFTLPETVDLGQPTKRYYPAEQTANQTVSVWLHEASAGVAKQYPYGSIQIGRKLLCLDVNTDDFHRNLFPPIKRTALFAPTLMAPWSHYLDGAIWGGYYDFVFLVAAKLCRFKEALPESEFKAAFVSYPLFGTSYERDFLDLLGVSTGQVVDSRTTNVTFERCVLANTGHWFYPNKADIFALRKYVLAQVPPIDEPRKRIYISRSGRRRILNESAVTALLQNYGFEIIEDIPRSVTEQVRIYQNAEFIIGPHGASFSNIVWCQPGTQLFEIFAPTYTPGFFRYLAHTLGLGYSAYYHGPAGTGDWSLGLEDDIEVSIAELELCMKNWLPVATP